MKYSLLLRIISIGIITSTILLFSQNTNSIHSQIATLYENDAYDEAYQKAGPYYESMKNNFAFRKLYFHILLKKNLFARALVELKWLAKIQQNIEIDYLEALYYYQSGQIEKAKAKLNIVLQKDKRHISTLLLLIDIANEKHRTAQTVQYLKQIETIEPNNETYLYKKGKFYLNRNAREFNKVLNRLNELYSESPWYFHLNALSLQNQKKFKQALTWLNRALYYKPKNTQYLNLKAELYFSLNEYRNLIKFLQKKIISTDNAEFYYLASLHYAMAKKSAWKVDDPNYIKINILPNIKNYLKSESDDELIRHFGELIVLSNFSYTEKEREIFVPYHLYRAKYFHENGNYQQAKSEYLYSIRLSPQNIEYRKTYVKLLKDLNLEDSYLEQLGIIRTLSAKKDDYKLNTTIDILKRKLRDRLPNQANVPNDKRASTKTRVLIIENEETAPTLDNFLKKSLFHSLLKLEFSSIHKANFFSIKANQQEQAIKQNNIDLILRYKLLNYQKGRSIGLSILLYHANTRKLIDKKNFYTSGKDKVFKINQVAKEYIQNKIPLKGRVLKINTKSVIISLGVLDGVKVKDKFNIHFSNNPTDTVPIEITQVDETISRANIIDRKNINFIKINNIATFATNQ